MAVHITIIGATDRKLEDIVRTSGLRPAVASAIDLLSLTHPSAAQPDMLVIDIRSHGQVPAALARGWSGTLFIDMHPAYGDAAVLLGAEPRFSLGDALDNTHRLDLAFFNGLTTQTKAGVTLLASADDAPGSSIDAHRIRLLL